MSYSGPKTAAEIIAKEKADVLAWKKHSHNKKMALHGNKHMALSHSKGYSPSPTYSERQGGGKSTRNYFKGTGTHVEADKKGVRGYYHGTNVAKMDKKGALHFNSGGYYTPTTARRMTTFAREHGGLKDVAIGRSKGKFYASRGGKKIAHSSEHTNKSGGHRMTIKP